MQSEARHNLTMLIFTVGISWGTFAFFLGLVGSFAMNSIRLLESLAMLVGCLIVLPAWIIAIWKPKVSAFMLVASVILVEALGLTDEGLHGAYLVGMKLGFPTFLLASEYAYLASVGEPFRR